MVSLSSGFVFRQPYKTKKNVLKLTTTSNVVVAKALIWRIFSVYLDELFGIVGDVLPLRVGELVLARPDALLHARGDGQTVVRVEGGEPAKPETKIN
jgi:hypothetical protein